MRVQGPSTASGQMGQLQPPHGQTNRGTDDEAGGPQQGFAVNWFNRPRLLDPIGNTRPAEAEGQIYAAIDDLNMAA